MKVNYFVLNFFFLFFFSCHSNENIYLSNINEEFLFSSLYFIESDLKFYIYNTNKIFRSIELKHSLKHFRSEYLFTNYLKMLVNLTSSSDHRKNIIVTNPEDANIFLIDHKLFNGIFQDVEEMTLYIKTIIDHVLNDFPYYQRYGGSDHYFFGVHSNGENNVTFYSFIFILSYFDSLIL